MQIYTQALKQFLLKDGPTDRRTPKRNGPKVVFIIPSARREVELRDEKVLATWPWARSSTPTPSRSTSRHERTKGSRHRPRQRRDAPGTRARRRRDERREPDHANDGISQEPEHALVKMGRRFFSTRSSGSTRVFALHPFCRSRARFAQRSPLSLGGTRRIPLFGAQPSEPVHDHIWEWNSIPARIPNTPAYQRALGECREQKVVVVVDVKNSNYQNYFAAHV